MQNHTPETDSQPAARTDITVWIVEDSEEYRNTVSELIGAREGMRCTRTFGSCEDVLETLNQEFAPDVILMDISLPGMSGIECVKRFKVISPATHVVMLTIHEDNDRIFNALCAGASGYLLKMSTGAKICEAIEEVHAGGAAMTPQVARRVLNIFSQLNAPRWDYQLTDREKEILELLVDGATKEQAAEALFLSFHTIDTHIRNIYAKLHVNSRTDAVTKALRERLV